MRILGCSASLGMLVTLALAGCGGGGADDGETPKPTATTARRRARRRPPRHAADHDGRREGRGRRGHRRPAARLGRLRHRRGQGAAHRPVQGRHRGRQAAAQLRLEVRRRHARLAPRRIRSTPTQKAGKYRADLEVKDSAGDSDSDYLEIDVQ